MAQNPQVVKGEKQKGEFPALPPDLVYLSWLHTINPFP